MIWKECLVLSVALFVLCEGRSAFSEVIVKKHNKGSHSEVSKSDHKSTENHEEYEKSHPSYEFSYKVIDPHTHDKKGQEETRDGDKVTGLYWLIQPDGHKRLVKYSVDGKHGFTADVNYALPDEHHKDDSEHDVHESEHEHKEEGKENDHKGDDKPDEDIKEEIKEEEHKDKELEKELEEFESKKVDEREEEKKIDEKHDEEDRKEEKKSDEPTNVHEKEENDHKKEQDHDLWSRKHEKEDKHDDVWSWPKSYSWGGEIEYKDNKNSEVHEDRISKKGNVWAWRKSYDVSEVSHHGSKRKEENDNKDKDIQDDIAEKRPEEDGDKKKGRRRNVGLRDYEHRGQPSYHTPIMRAKPIAYRRRRIVN